MVFSFTDFNYAMPEIVLLGIIGLTILVELFGPVGKKSLTYFTAQCGLFLVAILIYKQISIPGGVAFYGAFIQDRLTSVLQMFIVIASFVTLLYARPYIQQRDIPTGDFYILSLLTVLGMMLLVAAHNLLSLFLALELSSLPLYALVALQRDAAKPAEASIKYFITGAIATGMLLYGFSMLYGASNSLDSEVIARAIADSTDAQLPIFIFAMIFVIAGVVFKFGAVPFHMWAPDVYDGAPSAVTLFISGAPKLAALGLAFRLFVDTMPHLQVQWQPVLMAIAMASIVLGNVAAIVQQNIKRMLAYSSIAHMGYMMLGLVAGTAPGYAASLFYMINYTVMSLAAFGLVVLMSKSGFEAENIDDLKGLNGRNSWLALMMLFVMFSMAGVPPLVGFFSKVAVLEALISVHLTWLVVFALVFAVIGCYYYLRVVKTMYFEAPEVITPIAIPADVKITLGFNGIFILVLGIFPTALFNLCMSAF